MIDKHCFYKYGSVALSCLFFLMLIVAMTLEESEQSKTSNHSKFQSKMFQLEPNKIQRVIFLPPPPLETPKIKRQTSKVLQRPFDSNLITTSNK